MWSDSIANRRHSDPSQQAGNLGRTWSRNWLRFGIEHASGLQLSSLTDVQIHLSCIDSAQLFSLDSFLTLRVGQIQKENNGELLLNLGIAFKARDFKVEMQKVDDYTDIY